MKVILFEGLAVNEKGSDIKLPIAINMNKVTSWALLPEIDGTEVMMTNGVAIHLTISPPEFENVYKTIHGDNTVLTIKELYENRRT